jgi:patatin-like phospholipase/acyl hydrolase
MSKPPEKHSMKGWGARYADMDEPRTLDEAQAWAAMATADRMLDILTVLQTIEMRLGRIEVWLEETAPGYREAYRRDHRSPDVAMYKAITGVKIH